MSSGSESDDEYVPGEPEQVSEEGSGDEETDLQYDTELEHKAKKRKAIKETKGKKKRKTRNGGKEREREPETEEIDDEPIQSVRTLDPVEEKKREDDLWAKFLEGTDTKPKATTKESSNNVPVKPVDNDKSTVSTKKESNDDSKDREKRIFEFAGETIVVENNIIKEKIKTAEASVSKLQGPSRARSSGGLSDILGQLNKKDQLSTLEKSKLDWVTYKQEEGIQEEIQSHNKGKSGYLDRQDFLERADHRQYEIERDLRMSRRSNR